MFSGKPCAATGSARRKPRIPCDVSAIFRFRLSPPPTCWDEPCRSRWLATAVSMTAFMSRWRSRPTPNSLPLTSSWSTPSEVASPCAGSELSNRNSPTRCPILVRWRWSSPLTARSADNSYRTFAGGLRRELSRKLSLQLYMDRRRRRGRRQRPLLPQQSDRPRFLVRVPLRHAADQHHRQPRPRILSRFLDRPRTARPALAPAGRHRLLRVLHPLFSPR